MDKGFVILAENTNKVDYVKCATALALSLKNVMPECKIALISNSETNCELFDHVIKLPYGDLAKDSEWKLINDWQVYDASPFTHTIKLEADMYIPRSIEYWWEILENRDVVVSTSIRNFQQNISDIRVYRRLIDENQLPDCYNAITYFKKSENAKKFFDLVKNIFENWEEYRSILKCKSDEPATTDWVYALACHILGKEITTFPSFDSMSMVHMKQFINQTRTEDWTDTFVYEIYQDVLRVNTCPQIYPFHYHVKSFADKILDNIIWKKTNKKITY